MYVAVKGGERAIDNAHAWLAEARRGDRAVPALSVAQIRTQMALAVARVMAEGSLYDPDLAALAIKQARGDLIEAIFLIRAYRTTLPRLGSSRPVETGAMAAIRRISATFKDLPGGQVLGPTFDYTHRLLDFTLMAEGAAPPGPDSDPPQRPEGAGRPPGATAPAGAAGVAGGSGPGAGAPAAVPDRLDPAPSAQDAPPSGQPPFPRVSGFLGGEGVIEPAPADDTPPGDLTRAPMELPADRAVRLQALARGDEGFLLGLAYSSQRGYGRTHPFVSELRIGEVTVEVDIPELGLSVAIGTITVTECETVNQFTGSKTRPAQFTRGYGLVMGQCERKAIAMSLVDRALRWEELGEENTRAPVQDQEFVLMHADNIQATGFVEHIKLPHYVDFQSELELVRRLRAQAADGAQEDTP